MSAMLANAPKPRIFTHVHGDVGVSECPLEASDDRSPHAFRACQPKSYIAMATLGGKAVIGWPASSLIDAP